MGDMNAVDIAQATHTRVLELAGCMRKEEIMCYRVPLPWSQVLETLYIDDHAAIAIVPLPI